MTSKRWLAYAAGLMFAAAITLMIVAVNMAAFMTAYFTFLAGAFAGAAAMLLVRLHLTMASSDDAAEAKRLYQECLAVAHIDIAPAGRVDG